MTNPGCWICFGCGTGLCPAHTQEVAEQMAKWNIDRDTAITNLRQSVIEDREDEA